MDRKSPKLDPKKAKEFADVFRGDSFEDPLVKKIKGFFGGESNDPQDDAIKRRMDKKRMY